MNEKPTSFHEDLEKEGYSKEEEYFYRINRDLIERKRKELDIKRVEQKANATKSIHWMKCPKCGNQMKEINFSGIYAEQCEVCKGIYFDQGEFETLLEAKMPRNILKDLLSRIRSKITKFDVKWKP